MPKSKYISNVEDIMYWIVTSVNFVLTIAVVCLIVYLFYKVDVNRSSLEEKIETLDRKILRVIGAINATNLSEYKFDMQQQHRLDTITR